MSMISPDVKYMEWERESISKTVVKLEYVIN
jgi:hypothetical protein